MTATTVSVIPGNKVINDIPRARSIYALKYLICETAATVDNGDFFTVDLANYDGATLQGIASFRHSTDNSVIVTEDATCAVSGTEVTVTFAGSTAKDKRIVQLFFS